MCGKCEETKCTDYPHYLTPLYVTSDADGNAYRSLQDIFRQVADNLLVKGVGGLLPLPATPFPRESVSSSSCRSGS